MSTLVCPVCHRLGEPELASHRDGAPTRPFGWCSTCSVAWPLDVDRQPAPPAGPPIDSADARERAEADA